MDKIKKEATEETCAVYQCQIIQMVGEIGDENYLKFIHNLLISFKKKWGI